MTTNTVSGHYVVGNTELVCVSKHFIIVMFTKTEEIIYSDIQIVFTVL